MSKCHLHNTGHSVHAYQCVKALYRRGTINATMSLARLVHVIIVESHEGHGFPNHQQLVCLFNSLFKVTKKTPSSTLLFVMRGIHWQHLVFPSESVNSAVSATISYRCDLSSDDSRAWWRHQMETGPLCGEFTGHRWIPLTKVGDAEHWCFQTVE